jgi:hypothetical protein
MLLDDLADDVTAALSGELRAGTYWRSEEIGIDPFGNPIVDWVSYPCEGTRGSYDAEYAGLSGIPRDNARIEIIAGTLAVTARNLDRINIEGAWWEIVQVETDPATAVWLCQCAASTDPTA